jgi:protein-disulfide isomerase
MTRCNSETSPQARRAATGSRQSWRAVWIWRVLAVCVAGVLPSSFAVAQISPGSQSNQATQTKSSEPSSQPVALFDGQPIYETQFPANEQTQLQRMMLQVYGVKRRALQTVLDQTLIEAAAKKKGVTPDELFKAESDSKVPDPTEEQVSAYYQSHQGQINQPYDEVKEKLRDNLKALEIQKARLAYVQGLLQQALNDGDLVVMLRPPKVDVSPDPARLRGNPKAPITIVEFSDFSCAYCRKAEATIYELLAKYPDTVKLGYRDFPLRQMHPQAQLAAEASRCAGEQDKYWEYHDLLFANGDKLSRDDLIADARMLKLDDQKFDACLSSGRFKPQIEGDIQLGMRSGVISVPAFFVNGIFLEGAQPLEVFEKMVKEAAQP